MDSMRIGKTALVTTDAWFIAPDGRQYRAVFGTVRSINTSEDQLGVRTNAKSTNWYVEIGGMLLAGCQIHYAVATTRERVNLGEVEDSLIDGAKEVRQNLMSRIYDADQLAG